MFSVKHELSLWERRERFPQELSLLVPDKTVSKSVTGDADTGF